MATTGHQMDLVKRSVPTAPCRSWKFDVVVVPGSCGISALSTFLRLCRAVHVDLGNY